MTPHLNLIWQISSFLFIIIAAYFVLITDKIPKSYLSFLCISLIILRIPSFMVGEFFSNDEGEWISGAYSYLKDGKFWQEVDTSTSGPLVFLIPISVILTGFHLDYATIRLFGVVLSLIPTFCFLYYALKNLFNARTSQLVLLILWVSLGFTSSGDIIGYNSEAIPTLLFSIALYYFSTLEKQYQNYKIVIIGLCLGALFWAKPQAIITGLVGFVCIITSFFLSKKPLKTYLYFFLGGLIPSVIVLSYIFINDLWQFFFVRFVQNNFLQALSGLPIATHPRSYIFTYFWNLPEMRLLFIGAAVCSIILPFIFKRQLITWRALACYALFFSGIWSLVQTSNFFEHYKIIAIVQTALMWGLIIDSLGQRYKFFEKTVLVLVVITGFYQIYVGSFLKTYQTADSKEDLELLAILMKTKQPNDRLAIWGGKSNLYVMTGMLRGSAEAHTTYALTRTGELGEFYQDDFLLKLEQRHTRFFLEPIPKGFWRDKFGYEHYPKVNNYLMRKYTVFKTCDAYRLFVRK